MGFGFGILAGIVGTTLAYVFWYFIPTRVFMSFVGKIPRCFPQSRNISGIWETRFWRLGTTYEEVAIISQFFSRVWGVIEFQKHGQLRKYKMIGSIKENVLSATYEIITPKEPLDRGSFTLVLSPDGTSMEGRYAWTDDESRVPRGNKYVWSKPECRGINGIQIRRSHIHGKGVFANKGYQVGSEIAYFDGYQIDADTRHSLTLGGRKIEPTGPLKYLNHSCNPNCSLRGRTLIARRQVASGKELTINYLETEDNISHSFKCRCGSSECMGEVCSRAS